MCVPSLARTVVYIVVRATWGQKRSRDQHLSDSITWTARSEHVVQGPRIILNIISRSRPLYRALEACRFSQVLEALCIGEWCRAGSTCYSPLCLCVFYGVEQSVVLQAWGGASRVSFVNSVYTNGNLSPMLSILAHRNGWVISLFD